MFIRKGILVIIVLMVQISSFAQPPRPLKYKWFYVSMNLMVNDNLPKVESLMERAAKVGYNGMVFADFKLNILDRMPQSYFDNIHRLRKLAKNLHMDIIPCVFPIGYSEGILAHDPNLVEGMPVKNEVFTVENGKANVTQDADVGIVNGGFEDDNGDVAKGWDFQDYPGKASFIDHTVKHSGDCSLRFQDVGSVDPKYGHARIEQTIHLVPFHEYRISVWIKTSSFESASQTAIEILPVDGHGPSLCEQNLSVKPTEDWTQHQVVFNSQNNHSAHFYLGTWGAKGGTIWFDDVKIETVGMVNVIRREGCPLTVKSEGGVLYKEGVDYEPVKDPKMGRDPYLGAFSLYHTPPPITLTSNSRIRNGQKLLVSFYVPSFTYDMQTSVCLMDPKLYQVLTEQMQQVEKLFHPSIVFMQHDEIRVANWCELCQGSGLTPGEQLAYNVRRCREIIRRVSPQAKVFVWSDMFDPYHNAHGDYYQVNGSWAGSWKGLSKDIGIVDWDFDIRAKDLPFFAQRGHEQILAGYYDNNVDYTRDWLKGSIGIPNVDGVMYTTWQANYNDLEKFADVVWGGEGNRN